MKRTIRRSILSLGIAAIVATCLYPPWTYGIAAVPRPGVDVAFCIKERRFAPLWSRPSNKTVKHEQAQTEMCSAPVIDIWILAAQWLAIVLVVTAASRSWDRRGAQFNDTPAAGRGHERS